MKDSKKLKIKFNNNNNNNNDDNNNNMEKKMEGLEVPKAKIHLDSPRATLKKVPNWKMSGYDCIHGYWSKTFTSTTDWQSKWIHAYKKQTYHFDPKRLLKKELPPPHQQQLQAHNVPTDDVENSNSTNQGGDLLISEQFLKE